VLKEQVQLDRIPLIITEDHAFTRTGMQQVLAADGRFALLGAVGTAVQTLKLARKTRPRLAVTDYMLPDGSGLEVVIELSRWVPECACVVVTGREDIAIMQPLMDAGARGLLSKGSAPELICEALVQVAEGGQVIDPVFARALEAQTAPVSLSPRELEVLLRIAQGMSNPAIAEDLSISAKTVETHRGSLMRKMDVSTTATLMVKAARAGLIDL
jgi:DNA-binding NarL/FixJ family response regulator